MLIYSIASSSSGNCTVIEMNDYFILIDCGITLRAIKQLVKDLKKIKAVFITHEHGDHVSGLGALSRKLPGLPVYVNEASVNKKPRVFEDCNNIINIDSGTSITVETLEILPFTTKHDSAYSVGFVINEVGQTKKFGFLTDSGKITPLMKSVLSECSALFIEADYDEDLLRDYEEYDELLKERISSDFGHLSNKQMLDFVETIGIQNLEFVIVGHLSHRTNSPMRVETLIQERFEPALAGKFKIAPLTYPVNWSTS